MKSITFEEHYVIQDIQNETMNANTADPNGVPMKVMLDGLEKKLALQMLMSYPIMINVFSSWITKMFKSKFYHTGMVHLLI